jgi:N-acetylmuramic acid 6-phosphate etherase
VLDGIGEQGEGDDEGSHRGHSAEEAQAVGAGVQDVDGEDRHEGGCAAEEYGEEVERNGAEEETGADHVAQAGKHGVDCETFFVGGGAALDHTEEAEEGNEAEEGEGVDQRCSVHRGEAAVEEVGEGDGEKQAADHGASRIGDLEDGGAPGDGVDEVLLGNEGGDEGTGGGTAEAATGADDEEDGVDEPDVVGVMQCEPEEGEGSERLYGVAGEDDGSAIVAVGYMAGGEDEEDAGKEEGEAGVAEREGGVGDLVDLPGDADGLGLGSHDAHEAGGRVEAELARLPGDGGAGTWLEGVGHASPYATQLRWSGVSGAIMMDDMSAPDRDMLGSLLTETRNAASEHLDELSTLEMLALINAEDAKVAGAVRAELGNVARAVDEITERFGSGGRLFYIGAGTSGRLGVLDASECPPTFSVEAELVQGLIAGGDSALRLSSEHSEDSRDEGAADLAAAGFAEDGRPDTLVGIAASGRTPYVLGAMEYAKSLGSLTVGLSCVPGSLVEQAAEIAITPATGAEVLTGSTRMKAGTATKMVLNMLSTGVMVRTGATFGNLMVNVRPTNAKLVDRAERIIAAAVGCDGAEAARLLVASEMEVKVAIVMGKLRVGREAAEERLAVAGGVLRAALAS